MPATIQTCENLDVIERLLSSVIHRARNAVEMWTLVCLGRVVPDRQAVVEDNCEVLRAHILVLRAWLQESGCSRETLEFVANLLAAQERFRGAFLKLTEFPALSLSDVQVATEALAEAYESIHHAAACVGNKAGFEVSALSLANADREAYSRDILAHLFETFQHALAEQTGA